jgi:hypothetical protein
VDVQNTLNALRTDIHDLRDDVKFVMTQGCAKRNGDLMRIDHVEDGLTEIKDIMKRLLYTSFITALGICAFLIKAFVIPLLYR